MPAERDTSAVDLLTGWAAALQRLTGGDDPEGRDSAHARLGLGLIARYTESHRRYHNLAHVAAVLSTVAELVGCADEPDVVRLAAWYHDAVYDPRSTDNEEHSAVLAAAELAEAGVPPAAVCRVAELIRCTAGHDAPPGDRDAEVLCDADLRVLAAAAPDYDRYTAAVRAEYAHVADGDWRAGRAAVLHGLLSLPRLFRTAPARAWEPVARANLRRELAALSGPSGGAARPP
ncbi:MAG: metal-dependent phosphohydrolase [Pseudonocardiales bacterium]|nr:MAG: metal-dependent phosphohydrolase [Pseudonocardiales bacterium]